MEIMRYVLMFGIPLIVAIVWRSNMAIDESEELSIKLYDKCAKKVCKKLKKQESLQRTEIEELVEKVEVSGIFKKSKLKVEDAKAFAPMLTAYMVKRNLIEEKMIAGKKVYYLK